MAEQDQRDREWNEQGEYTEMYSPEEVYDVLADLPNQVGMASDISDALGCSTLTARNKLQELQYERKIEQRDTSGRVNLWYIPGEEQAGTSDTGDTGTTSAGIADVLADTAPETVLKLLSHQIDDPITVGDTVYEDGDKHPVEDAD
jgi:predicted ArsR family transcriptional regulator